MVFIEVMFYFCIFKIWICDKFVDAKSVTDRLRFLRLPRKTKEVNNVLFCCFLFFLLRDASQIHKFFMNRSKSRYIFSCCIILIWKTMREVVTSYFVVESSIFFSFLRKTLHFTLIMSRNPFVILTKKTLISSKLKKSDYTAIVKEKIYKRMLEGPLIGCHAVSDSDVVVCLKQRCYAAI